MRPNPGSWEFVKVSTETLSVDPITAVDYLKFKEMVYDEAWYVNVVLSSVFSFLDLYVYV